MQLHSICAPSNRFKVLVVRDDQTPLESGGNCPHHNQKKKTHLPIRKPGALSRIRDQQLDTPPGPPQRDRNLKPSVLSAAAVNVAHYSPRLAFSSVWWWGG